MVSTNSKIDDSIFTVKKGEVLFLIDLAPYPYFFWFLP